MFPAKSERKNFEDVPPPVRLPTFVLEIVESRAIAHLKAKSEKNAVESSVWSYFPGFREEMVGIRQSWKRQVLEVLG